MLLEGKTAVVTGSSKGLGRAFAMALAKEGAGVVVNGTVAEDVNHVVDEIKSGGGNAVGCLESVATMTGAQRIIQAALDNFGHLDILVNNAGILRDRTLLNMTEEEWDTVISVHLKGTFACSKYAALIMSHQAGGCIINMTSGAAWNPNVGQCNYSAAKGGIVGLTIALSGELSRYNITVNTVWPRALTRMTMQLREGRLRRAKEEALQANRPTPSILDLGLGEPEAVAPLVVFLASDEAKDITGKIISFTGETMILWSPPREIVHATMVGGWSLEEIRRHFKNTLGKAL